MSNKCPKDWKLTNNLTIYDFANATRTCQRIPKAKFGVRNLIPTEETTVDDTSNAEEFDEEPPCHEEGPRAERKQCPAQTSIEPHRYNDIQFDIWFLISEHLAPEDVCRFALICQKTRYVVSTAKFWFHLYRKYYDRNIQLPVCLQPESLGHLGELRSSVIRSLFYTYPPFVQRLRTQPDPDSLLKFKCVAVWYRQIKDCWSMCYKFSRNYTNALRRNGVDVDEEDEIDSWEDIDTSVKTTLQNYQPASEEGNRILVVTTERFYPPPEFMMPNLHLSKIIQPLSQNLRTFKLELTFSEYNGKKVGSVTYDPVKQCKIIRWWEPEYYTLLG